MRIRPSFLLLLLLAGCPDDTPVEPGCGNGLLEGDEDCDDGEANGDVPDGCRADCTLPVCGDGVPDPGAGEDCDDGGFFGGDGCAPDCTTETLPGEAEPNQTPATATPMPGDAVIAGLPTGDTDCFSVDLPADGWISASLAPDEDGACPSIALSLVDPTGGLVATGTPGVDCSLIDPLVDPGARFTAAGTWTVCAEGFLGVETASYVLEVTTGADSCALPVPLTSEDDIDGDGLSAYCDLDDDGDGLSDDQDVCPELPNDGTPAPHFVDESGFIRDWLVLGPLADLPSESNCLPSDTQVLGDDAAAEPSVGEAAGGEVWQAYFDSNARLNYLNLMGGPTPREVYSVVWVRSETEQAATLALGLDDGGRAFLNGVEVLEVGSCQGTNVDQFKEPVTLLAGWNRLLIRVRDQGGGWGLYARFLDSADDPLTDLEISISGPESFAPDQTDTDGDGLGDWCDDEPGS